MANTDSLRGGVAAGSSEICGTCECDASAVGGGGAVAPLGLSSVDGGLAAELYIKTLRNAITGAIYRTPRVKGLKSGKVDPCNPDDVSPYDASKREYGRDWPIIGYTMVGGVRLDNIRDMVGEVIRQNIPGGFLEAGVWRGGASVYAAGVSKALGRPDMPVWVCDSFEGLPKAKSSRDHDGWAEQDFLKASLESVQDAFRAFDLLEPRVTFVKGFFDTSLYKLGKELKRGDLSVLRGDGDMYESFVDILYNLYDKLSVGGYFVCDDWTILEAIAAVKEFRQRHKITAKIHRLRDGAASFFIKEKHVKIDREWYLKFRRERGLEV